MKNVFLPALLIFSMAFNGYAQNSNPNPIPDYFKLLYESPEYYFGNVKEMHWQIYNGIEKDGKYIKGEAIKTGSSGIYGWWSHFFDDNGQLINVALKYGDDEWIGVIHRDNNLLKRIYWLKNDTLHYTYDYTFKTGKMERIRRLAESGEIRSKRFVDLDKNGFVLKIKWDDQFGEPRNSIEWERDNDGNITHKRIINPNGEIVTDNDKWIYNDHGLLEKVHRRIRNGEKTDIFGATHTYEFDKTGNWIKRTSINKENGRNRIFERIFVYQ